MSTDERIEELIEIFEYLIWTVKGLDNKDFDIIQERLNN